MASISLLYECGVNCESRISMRLPRRLIFSCFNIIYDFGYLQIEADLNMSEQDFVTLLHSIIQ